MVPALTTIRNDVGGNFYFNPDELLSNKKPINPLANTINLKDLPNFSSETPSFLFYLQSGLKASNIFGNLAETIKRGDKEGIVDGLSKGNTYILGSLAFLDYLSTNSVDIIINDALNPAYLFSPVGGALGLGICCLEIIFVSHKLFREINFLSSFPSPLKLTLPSYDLSQPIEKTKTLFAKWKNSLEKRTSTCQNPEIQRVFTTIEQSLEGLNSPQKEAYETIKRLSPLLEEIESLHLQDELKGLCNKHFNLTLSELESLKMKVEKKKPGLDPQEKQRLVEVEVKNTLLNKQLSFARRTNLLYVDEFKTKCPEIIQLLQSQDPVERSRGIQEASNLLKEGHIQGYKKLVSHILGLISVLLVTAVFTLFFFSVPFALFAPLLTAAGAIATANFILQAGFFPNKGLRFSFKGFIPPFVYTLWLKVSSYFSTASKTPIKKTVPAHPQESVDALLGLV